MNLGSPYFVLLTIGFALGCAWFVRRGEGLGLARVALIDVCIAAIVGGVVGSRLLHVLVEPLPSHSLSTSEVDEVRRLGGELGGADGSAVLAAVRGADVPAVWQFIARMPPGEARAEAVARAQRDPAQVPALLWYRAHPMQVFAFWRGGLAYIGGLALAVVLCLTVARRHGAPLREVVDVAAPAIVLGLVFGRLGCFLGGCCYGAVCEPHWWSTAPSWYVPPAGLAPRYPTALLSAAFAAGLFFALRWLLSRRAFAGEVILAMFALYAPGRFLVEAIRDDPRGGAAGLSTSQWGVLLTGVPALALWVGGRLMASARANDEPHACDEGVLPGGDA